MDALNNIRGQTGNGKYATLFANRSKSRAERKSIKAAYNHAQHLPERRKMMQHWADYLDSLKAGENIVSLRAAKGKMA